MGVLLVVAPVMALAVAVAVVPITIATVVLIIAPAPSYAIAIIAKLTTKKPDTRVGGGSGDKCGDDD